MKQRVTIKNTERGTEAVLLLDRRTCRLSIRQARETYAKLAPPGYANAGPLGEWPLVQAPPECGGTAYRTVEHGGNDGGMSRLYFLPVGVLPAGMKPEQRSAVNGSGAVAGAAAAR